MASIINATSSGSGGLVSTGDDSGELQIQTDGTARVTLNASGAIGVGSSPSYGTNGQVLTSAGSGAAPTWSTPSSGITSITAGDGLSGGTITTSGTISINTNNSLGVGAYGLFNTVAGGTQVDDGATCAGSNLLISYGGSGGSWTTSLLSPSGTWRNVTGLTITGNGGRFGIFIRTA